MANLNLTPKEILALYEMLCYPLKKAKSYEKGCECCGGMSLDPVIEEEDPMDSIARKLRDLLTMGIENIEVHGMKAKLSDWLEQEEERVQKLRRDQAEVNKGMRNIRDTFVAKKDVSQNKSPVKVMVDAELEDVKKDNVKVVPFDNEGVHFNTDELTRELNEDKEFKYPNPNAPRPVMPQHGKFRGKHKK